MKGKDKKASIIRFISSSVKSSNSLEEALKEIDKVVDYIEYKKITLSEEDITYIINCSKSLRYNLDIIVNESDLETITSEKIASFIDAYSGILNSGCYVSESYTYNLLDELLEKSSKLGLCTREEEIEYINKIRSGDEKAREDFILKNLRLVVHICKKYTIENPSMEIMDLVQEGLQGLNRAIDEFDLSKGSKFSTYATWWIRHGVREARENDRLIRLPANKRESIDQYRNAISKFYITRNGEPSDDELMKILNWDKEKLTLIKKLIAFTPVSLNCEVDDEGTTTLEHFISTEEKGYDNTLNKMLVDYLLTSDSLTEQERMIVIEKFGIDDGINKSLVELAKKHNISHQRVQQIVKKALEKLKFYADARNIDKSILGK